MNTQWANEMNEQIEGVYRYLAKVKRNKPQKNIESRAIKK